MNLTYLDIGHCLLLLAPSDVGPPQGDPDAPDLWQNLLAYALALHLQQPVVARLVVHSVKLGGDLAAGHRPDFWTIVTIVQVIGSSAGVGESSETVNIADIILVIKFLKKIVLFIITNVLQSYSSCLLTRGALTVNVTYSPSGVWYIFGGSLVSKRWICTWNQNQNLM